MSEITATSAASQLNLEQPNAIEIAVALPRRQRGAHYFNNAYRLDMQVFTVVGTNEWFAVYKLPLKIERWGLVHVPSGQPLFAKFRTRAEAEDFGSWVYLNTLHRAQLIATSRWELDTILGPRVRQRIKDGAVLVSKRPIRSRDAADDKTATEKLLEQCTAELRIRIDETEKRLVDRRKAFNDKEMAQASLIASIEPRLKNVKAAEEALSERIRAHDDNIMELATQRQAVSEQQQEVSLSESEVGRLRALLANAITAMDVSADTPVLRALRGVRIRGLVLDERNQPIRPVISPIAEEANVF